MTVSISFPNLQISPSFEIPESIFQLLDQAYQNHYEEFYEESTEQTATLEESLLDILNKLENSNDSLSHYRYIYLALILALAVEPTVNAYLPNDQKTEKIFQLIINWAENQEIPTEETIKQLFPQVSVGDQAIDEALDVFKNLLGVLNKKTAKESLLEILDDCLEGYAIFPGSQGRRELFHWLLSEVVPAAWCLSFPESIYTIKGIVSLDSIMLPNGLLKIKELVRENGTKSKVIKLIDC